MLGCYQLAQTLSEVRDMQKAKRPDRRQPVRLSVARFRVEARKRSRRPPRVAMLLCCTAPVLSWTKPTSTRRAIDAGLEFPQIAQPFDRRIERCHRSRS